MESVNSAHFKRWETEVQNFGKEKRKTLRQYWGAHFWQGEVQNSSPILARQWWRHFRLSLSLSLSLYLSLSLSPNVPHAQYRKRFRASYNEDEDGKWLKWRRRRWRRRRRRRRTWEASMARTEPQALRKMTWQRNQEPNPRKRSGNLRNLTALSEGGESKPKVLSFSNIGYWVMFFFFFFFFEILSDLNQAVSIHLG